MKDEELKEEEKRRARIQAQLARLNPHSKQSGIDDARSLRSRFTLCSLSALILSHTHYHLYLLL